jgi:putative salt-induced outer membrane protein
MTGEIVQCDGKLLKLKTPYAGTVEIQWDAIEKVSSEQPLYLTLSDSQMIVGPVTSSGTLVEVRAGDTGTVRVAREAIRTIRSKPAFDAYQAEQERLRNPGLLELWKGTADVGLSLTQGNSKTTNLAMGFSATRTTPRDKIGVYANSLYAGNTIKGVASTTANAIRGGGRYDININARTFGFGMGDLEFDEFQKLDLRMTLGGGLGWHAIKTEKTVFDLFGGGAYTKEYFSTSLRRSSGEILIGQDFSQQLSKRNSFKERFVLMPNLSETGEYRFNFDLGLVTNLSTWLGWHVTLSDRFLSNPVSGALKNDMLLTTGLRVAFGR